MKLPPFAILLAASFAAVAPSPLNAQVTTDIVGFNQVTCLANSDTVLSVPFMKQPLAHQGAVGTTEDVAANRVRVNPTFPGTWTNDQFANAYYVRFTTGNKAGYWYDVVSNSSTGLLLDTNGDTLLGAQGLAAGDKYVLVEHWTLDNLFPSATQTTINVSASNQAGDRKTEILLPNLTDFGVNLPPEGRYFLTAAGWRKDVIGFPAANTTILPPGSTFTVRHNASPTTSFTPVGVVLKARDVIPLATSTTTRQDNAVAIQRPVPVKLEDAGLGGAVFTPSLGHSTFQRRDELFAFDNSVAGLNKPASAIYYNVGGTWYRDAGLIASNPVANAVTAFEPGSGLVVRKYRGDGSTALWGNQATY